MAYILCAIGLVSIYLGLKVLLSLDITTSEVHGLPVGPKIPLITQGFLVFAGGVFLGVVCDINRILNNLTKVMAAKSNGAN
ncbi:hypothetical protein [Tropicibacter sp. Alg240-R139]|uniref:hypothetical protein n=1 Tax=Tropicibacter sp. Alg240-R139 TaxID=2305991 RepID=UPI0013E022F1|nr:hypothetical protein [Tropicibacter sp. Alg240-R139]